MKFTQEPQDGQFTRDGFIALPGFVNREQFGELRALYESSNIQLPQNRMYSNFHELSFEENQAIEQAIVRICQPSIDKYLEDYRIVGAAFIVKGVGADSDSRLHQDWRIVDEKRFRSVIVWIPLIDVDEDNGCLQVLPGSHTWFDSIRSSTVTSTFMKFDYRINPFVRAVPLRTGDCAVFASRVFHGSKSNRSGAERPAVTITLIDKQAHYVDYFLDREDHISILDCNDQEAFRRSYETYNRRDNGKARVLGEVTDVRRYVVTERDLLRRLYQERLEDKPLGKAWYNLISIVPAALKEALKN